MGLNVFIKNVCIALQYISVMELFHMTGVQTSQLKNHQQETQIKNKTLSIPHQLLHSFYFYIK